MAPASRRQRALRTPPRSTRGKPPISYAESSESELDPEEEESDSVGVAECHPTARSRRSISTRTTTTPKKRHHPSTSVGSTHGESSTKRRKHSKLNNQKSIVTQTQSQFTISTSGVVPPWQTLPYDILLQIFRYASYPLYDAHHFQPLPSGSWLLKVARLCKDFAEPAFTVLYTSPPLVPMGKAHMLVDLLKTDPAQLKFKYRQKVESLRIDVGQVAAYSLPGSGLLDLFTFIKDLPRLKVLEFYHQKDMSPYRNLEDTVKWTYPESLFDALEYVDPHADPLRGDKTSACRLESWRWSSRLAGKKYPLESIREIHLKPSFLCLQKIAFVNYQIPLVRKGEDEPPKHEELLANALSVLTGLKHLIFESSTLVNAKLLPLLPKSLHNLELINCWDFHADDFANFLISHGNQLRSLTLNHNLSLNLSFLPILGIACPKLEALQMNLSYFDMHSFYHDSEPNFDKLILPNEIPTWPSSLQTLELTQLRKWDTEACEMFFQSLLDSASNLPDLRRLTIQAILNIGWRDRASFRDKWIGSLEHVFRRVSAPPKADISSRIYGSAHNEVASAIEETKEPDAQGQEVVSEKKKSLQLSSGSVAPSASTFSVVINPPKPVEATESQTRRSTRKSTRQSQTGKYAESSDNSGDESADYKPEPEDSARHQARQTRVCRELTILKQTAGIHGHDLLTSPPQTESDDDFPLISRNRKGKAKEFVQGMCEVVDIRIDNLRPRETMVTEADFLDEEASGDEDWNGEDGFEEAYAW